MKKNHLLIIGFMLFSFSAPAHAACEPALDVPSGSARTVEYDPFSGHATRIDVNIRLSNKGDTPCQLRLEAFSDDNAAHLQGPGKDIAFNISGDGLWRSSRGGPVLASMDINVPAGSSSVSENITFSLPEGQVVPPGMYTQGFRFRLYDTGNANFLIDESRAVNVSAHVLPRADALLSFGRRDFGAGGSVTVFDLGTLHSGLTDTIYLQLRANAPASIEISSKNGGRLLHKRDPSLKPISYDLSVDRKPVPLLSAYTITAKAPPSSRGRALPMTFRIGDISGRMAGIYSDTIHVTVTAY